MRKIVIDTSIFIEQIRTGRGVLTQLVAQAPEDVLLIIPTIVIYELYAGLSMAKENVRVRVNDMYKDQERIDLDERIAEKAGKLKREKYVDGNDAVIAATTLLCADYLATLNVKHFAKVPGLKLWKPSQK